MPDCGAEETMILLHVQYCTLRETLTSQ